VIIPAAMARQAMSHTNQFESSLVVVPGYWIGSDTMGAGLTLKF